MNVPDERTLHQVHVLMPTKHSTNLTLLSLHTAAPSFEYYVQLRCQCKVKRKIVGDKKSAIVRLDKRYSVSAEEVKLKEV